MIGNHSPSYLPLISLHHRSYLRSRSPLNFPPQATTPITQRNGFCHRGLVLMPVVQIQGVTFAVLHRRSENGLVSSPPCPASTRRGAQPLIRISPVHTFTAPASKWRLALLSRSGRTYPVEEPCTERHSLVKLHANLKLVDLKSS